MWPFKPKWEHKDCNIRIAAVKKLKDQKILAEIAKNDNDFDVRIAAVDNPYFTDQVILTEIAKDPNDPTRHIRKCAIEKITDQATLADIAKNEHISDPAIAAIMKVTDPVLLADIWRTRHKKRGHEGGYSEANLHMRRNSIIRLVKFGEGIFKEEILAEIALNEYEPILAKTAIDGLTDKGVLNEIAQKRESMKKEALARIEKLKVK
jgi:hypothetical protein